MKKILALKYQPSVHQDSLFITDPNCDSVNLIFYDHLLEEEDFKVFRDSAFGSHLVLINLNELPQHTNLSICEFKSVEITGGRWRTYKEAIEFLKPWYERVKLFNASFIWGHFYVYLDHEQSFFYTLELENDNIPEPLYVPYDKGQHRIEQLEHTWRGKESYSRTA